MEPTLYFCATSFCQNFKSLKFVQAKPSSFIACNQFSLAPGLSNEMPKTVKFLVLNLSVDHTVTLLDLLTV